MQSVRQRVWRELRKMRNSTSLIVDAPDKEHNSLHRAAADKALTHGTYRSSPAESNGRLSRSPISSLRRPARTERTISEPSVDRIGATSSFRMVQHSEWHPRLQLGISIAT